MQCIVSERQANDLMERAGMVSMLESVQLGAKLPAETSQVASAGQRADYSIDRPWVRGNHERGDPAIPHHATHLVECSVWAWQVVEHAGRDDSVERVVGNLWPPCVTLAVRSRRLAGRRGLEPECLYEAESCHHVVVQ